MRHDEKNDTATVTSRAELSVADTVEDGHVVFDFTGLRQVKVEDLALVLTARLCTDPADTVWVRSVTGRTEQILKLLRLDHLFLHLPEDRGEPN